MENDFELILIEVVSSFTSEEIKAFKNFEEFWSQVDIQNAYEEEWTEEAKANYKPIYKKVYFFLGGKP